MAITNPKDKNKYLRASQIIVPCDSKGFSLVRRNFSNKSPQKPVPKPFKRGHSSEQNEFGTGF